MFDYYSRSRLRECLIALERMDKETCCPVPVLREIRGIVSRSHPPLDTLLDEDWIGFDYQWVRYYASPVGLWCLPRRQVTAQDWWIAYLRAHARAMGIRRLGIPA